MTCLAMPGIIFLCFYLGHRERFCCFLFNMICYNYIILILVIVYWSISRCLSRWSIFLWAMKSTWVYITIHVRVCFIKKLLECLFFYFLFFMDGDNWQEIPTSFDSICKGCSQNDKNICCNDQQVHEGCVFWSFNVKIRWIYVIWKCIFSLFS